MFTPGLILFGSYALVLWTLELRCHSRRRPRGRERFTRPVSTALWAALGAIAVFGDYGHSIWANVYSALAGLLMTATIVDQAFGPYAHRRDEQVMRSIGLILFPLVLGTHLAVWRFIDGAGFFMGMVMPVSTANLRPLATGFTAMFAALAAYQLFAVRRKARKAAVAPVVPAQAPAPAAAPAATEEKKAA